MYSISEETDSDKFEQAKNYFLIGLENFEKGTYLEAEKFLFLALDLLPERLSTLTNLSAVLIKLGKLEKAHEILSKGINLYPTNETLYLNFGNLHGENKNWQMSLDCYDKAIEFSPDFSEAIYSRGIALVQLNQLEEALVSYERAIKIKPDFADAYLNRGNALQDLNRFEEAVASYDMAIKIEPNNSEAHNNRGNALQELERMEEAFISYGRAIEITPNSVEPYLNLGDAFQNSRHFEEALACYDSATVSYTHLTLPTKRIV